ncbi:hypothetical protein F5Y16DRAFT_360028 [Xylariaceae sp. FL0255]|nr:hypothetical protein F5Y16DRAFT_360028 [Xylariaceae sp. FL0255]
MVLINDHCQISWGDGHVHMSARWGDIGIGDWLGRTPLWYAVINGHGSIVHKLLKRGANVAIWG